MPAHPPLGPQGVSILIDETYVADPKLYNMAALYKAYGLTAADATSGSYPFLATGGRVLRSDKRLAGAECMSCSGANCSSSACHYDWLEGAFASPQRVLSDIVAFTHPTAQTGYTTYYMRNIAASEAITFVTASQCADRTALCPGETAVSAAGAAARAPVGMLLAALLTLLMMWA